MVRAALYARVSSAQQATEDKVSLSEQVADMEAYCKAHGYEIVARYQDVGSGASKRRPGFQKMLKAVPAGEFDVIVGWKSDRLSRGMFPAAALMEAIEGTQVRIEGVKDTIDLKSFGLMAAVGKIELDAIRERTRMGHRGRAKKGLAEAQVPFGYTRKGKKEEGFPIEHPIEAEAVRRVFAEYVAGTRTKAIAEGLNRDGYRTRKGKAFDKDTIFQIVRDPVYKGEGYYDRRAFTTRDDGERERVHVQWKPADQWIAVPFPALVTPETWDVAQERRKRDSHIREPKGRDMGFTLRGMVYCAHHGARFIPYYTRSNSYYRRKDGSIYRKPKVSYSRRYVCYAAKDKGDKCERKSIGAPTLETMVWNQVRRVLGDAEHMSELRDARRNALVESGSQDALERYKRDLAAAEEEERRAQFMFMKGYVDETGLRKLLQGVKERKEHYAGEVGRLEREVGGLEAQIAMLDDLQTQAAKVAARLDSMTAEERAQILRLAVDKVVIHAHQVEIVLALGRVAVPIANCRCPRRRRGSSRPP